MGIANILNDQFESNFTQIFQRLLPHKVMGLEQISARVMKELASTIVSILTEIYSYR